MKELIKVLVTAFVGILGSGVAALGIFKFVQWIFSMLPLVSWIGIVKVAIILICMPTFFGICVAAFMLAGLLGALATGLCN